MGKSKHNKWFDEYEESPAARKNDWERRRQEKRHAWEQKHSTINPNGHQDADSKEYE